MDTKTNEELAAMSPEELADIALGGLNRLTSADLVVPDAELAIAEMLRRLTSDTSQ